MPLKGLDIKFMLIYIVILFVCETTVCLFRLQIDLLSQVVSWIILSIIPGCKLYVKYLLFLSSVRKLSFWHGLTSQCMDWSLLPGIILYASFLTFEAYVLNIPCSWMQCRKHCQFGFVSSEKGIVLEKYCTYSCVWMHHCSLLDSNIFLYWKEPFLAIPSQQYSTHLLLLSFSEMRLMSPVSLTGIFCFWEYCQWNTARAYLSHLFFIIKPIGNKDD